MLIRAPDFINLINEEIVSSGGDPLPCQDVFEFLTMQFPKSSACQNIKLVEETHHRLYKVYSSIPNKGISFQSQQKAKHNIITNLYIECEKQSKELVLLQREYQSIIEKEIAMAEREIPALPPTEDEVEFLDKLAKKWTAMYEISSSLDEIKKIRRNKKLGERATASRENINRARTETMELLKVGAKLYCKWKDLNRMAQKISTCCIGNCARCQRSAQKNKCPDAA